ncbi:hypothetical protein K32_49510 [Kaistia sp. 32K]|uniref:hypothetical protein n=1 Tax=Kaistia sp. 32K TaxID=2795690 RepID=UPI0019151990|nr:hypothetical protein [Kaistia sp. 32K]BCP56334.1 hypothetical protein K32_49510 [Kaistia sp. 32K]
MTRILAVLALCAIAAGGGALAATWKAEADHGKVLEQRAETIQKLKDEKAELLLAIADQNKAVAVAEAQTLAANEAKAKAQQHAADLAGFSKSRMDKLERFMADTAEQVLKAYWELRQ